MTNKEKLNAKNNRLGQYVTQTIASEPFKAYVPLKLSQYTDLNIELDKISVLLERASLSISKLNNIADNIPNKALFLYMYVRKEALVSSQIEGTQSSLSDLMLFEHQHTESLSVTKDDVEEVSNYVKGLSYGLKKLKSGFPLCLRLIKEVHGILLKGTRGKHKQPGEFRRSQNWIGGTRPGNARFVPPPPELLPDLLGDLENFINNININIPVLVKAGLVHVQFETIHPFLDGNGRLGRLLIILLLCENKVLHEPILYLSLYFKQHRDYYYDLLQRVRTEGVWEEWLTFFLEGVEYTSIQAINTAEKLNKIFEQDVNKINKLGRAKLSCLKVFEYLQTMPQVSVVDLTNDLDLTPPTIRASLANLERLKIIKDISTRERNKVYKYTKYFDLIQDGIDNK